MARCRCYGVSVFSLSSWMDGRLDSVVRRHHISPKFFDKEHKKGRYLGRYYGLPIRLKNETDAKEFVRVLRKPERELLVRTLIEQMRTEKAEEELRKAVLGDEVTRDPSPLTREQIRSLFLVNALPFVGFGFLDNLIMILAGEYIDMTIGVILGISTMAAAALGNIISDVCGVGLAHYVEFIVSKCGIRPPNLSQEQWDSGKARWAANAGRAFGITAGCIIGMFPLLFFHSDKDCSAEEGE